MEKFLLDVVNTVNTYLTDYVLLILLVGTGLFFTIRTKFVQVRCFGEGIRQVFGNLSLRGGKRKGGLSSFQALATAIAAQVGTGNIVGACAAIFIGGPGAIFWMWIIAFLGMSTIYAEATLAQKTKKVNQDGSVDGGPVRYIKEAFGGKFGKFLAAFFAVVATLALGFMGAMVQSNSIASNFANALSQFASSPEAAETVTSVTVVVVGVLVAGIAAFILIGGVQRLASVAEKIVPIMAVLYIVGGLFVICINIVNVPLAFGLIFKYAFVPDALIGGGLGAIILAITQGAKRGLFSNEAGMGSTPHSHALANVKDPHKQGTSAMISVFIDTFIVLTMTALVVISTLYTGNDAIITPETYSGLKDSGFATSTMAQAAFSRTFAVLFGTAAGNVIGSVFVAVCLFFFAFSTIISWNYYGKVNFEYLFGKKATIVYSVIAVAFIFVGSLTSNDLVWALTDMFNNLMVIPNVIALIALSGFVAGYARKKNVLPDIDGDATPDGSEDADETAEETTKA